MRVSTDEQAVKGYSQRSQLDRLVHYCKDHNLIVTKTIFEDYSAKTFNRPECNGINCLLSLSSLKTNLHLFSLLIGIDSTAILWTLYGLKVVLKKVLLKSFLLVAYFVVRIPIGLLGRSSFKFFKQIDIKPKLSKIQIFKKSLSYG